MISDVIIMITLSPTDEKVKRARFTSFRIHPDLLYKAKREALRRTISLQQLYTDAVTEYLKATPRAGVRT